MLMTVTCKKDYKRFVSPEIEPYVNEFLELLSDNDIKVKDQDFVVMFSLDVPHSGIAGYAVGMFNDDFVSININPIIWGFLNNSQKRTLIFHELSHDLFNTLHSDDVFVMNPQLHQPLRSSLNDTSKSDKELPPKRFAPCIPPEASPQAYNPFTVDS